MGLFGNRGPLLKKSDGSLLLYKHFTLVKKLGDGNYSSV